MCIRDSLPGTSSSLDGGNPIAAAVLSASSTSLSFGNVALGTSTAQLISFKNIGTKTLSILGVSTAGNGFNTSAGSNITLTPNQSLTISVNFVPAAPGNVTGALLVSSNASNSTVQVELSGTGITANVSQHSVALSWTPSTSPVAGYFVYRSTVSGGPYTRVNSTIDQYPTFTDTGLPSGTYFYTVTSVSADNVESGFSNEVEVIIP